MTLLISFGAGVGAPDCASACGEPAVTVRWIVALSLVIFLLPLTASPRARRYSRRLLSSLSRAFSQTAILVRRTGRPGRSARRRRSTMA